MKIIFLGGQGSGKSTQEKLLADNLNFPLVEMGQIFRDKAQDQDKEGLLIKKSLDEGELVPDQIAISTLRERLSRQNFNNGYIIDGYPRNSAQKEGLEKDVDIIFYINVSDEEAIRRLSLRGREDDTKEALERRLEIYHRQTEPLLAEFKKQQ